MAPGAEYGPVTCLDLSADQSRLVVGHRQGHIVFYEVLRGRMLKTLVAGERHARGLAIVSVQFLQASLTSVLAFDSKASGARALVLGRCGHPPPDAYARPRGARSQWFGTMWDARRGSRTCTRS